MYTVLPRCHRVLGFAHASNDLAEQLQREISMQKISTLIQITATTLMAFALTACGDEQPQVSAEPETIGHVSMPLHFGGTTPETALGGTFAVILDSDSDGDCDDEDLENATVIVDEDSAPEEATLAFALEGSTDTDLGTPTVCDGGMRYCMILRQDWRLYELESGGDELDNADWLPIPVEDVEPENTADMAVAFEVCTGITSDAPNFTFDWVGNVLSTNYGVAVVTFDVTENPCAGSCGSAPGNEGDERCLQTSESAGPACHVQCDSNAYCDGLNSGDLCLPMDDGPGACVTP